jgi:hypothetical protein
MNRPESNTAGAIVDFRVDKDTNFKRTIEITVDGTMPDLNYWEAELVVFWPKTCKEIKVWSITSGDLVISGLGTIDWNILIEIEAGKYEYYFLVVDDLGDPVKYFKGRFIVE